MSDVVNDSFVADVNRTISRGLPRRKVKIQFGEPASWLFWIPDTATWWLPGPDEETVSGGSGMAFVKLPRTGLIQIDENELIVFAAAEDVRNLVDQFQKPSNPQVGGSRARLIAESNQRMKGSASS